MPLPWNPQPACIPSDQRRSAETRQRLLTTARRIFLRKGFHAASLADIAKGAGFTKGAVFSQFESKADLFLALLEERSNERIGRLKTLRREPLTAASIGRWLSSDFSANIGGDRDWTLLVIEFRVYAARNPSAGRRYAALHSRTCARMAEVYAGIGGDAGLESVLDLDTLARVVLGITAGFLLEQVAKPELDVAPIMGAIAASMIRINPRRVT